MKEEILKKNSYLLCGGSFFSTKISCFLVAGLYFLAFNFTFAFKSSTQNYKNGTFNNSIIRVLEKFDDIMNIILPKLRISIFVFSKIF